MTEREAPERADGISSSERATTARVDRAPEGGNGFGIQRKLAVGSSSDPLEAEADRVADQVVAAARRATASPGPRVAPTVERVRRSAMPNAASAAGGDLDAGTESRIRRSTGGESIDPTVRSRIEPVIGADLSGVRIHRNSDLAPQIQAKAFTHGRQIHFAPGTYDPSSVSGLRLLAHEATHTVQQGAVPTTGGEPKVQRAMSTSVQRSYDALSPSGKVRVDALAERDYARKTTTLENAMGPMLSREPAAHLVVDKLLAQLRVMVEAWADSTGQTLDATYEQEFAFAASDKYYGAFTKTAATVTDVFDNAATKPLRTKLHLIYNAVRNNTLSKYLEVASLELVQVAQNGVATAQTIDETTGPLGGPTPVTPTERTVQPGFAAASGLATPLADAPWASPDQPQVATERFRLFGDIAEQRKETVPAGGRRSRFAADKYSDVLKPDARLTIDNESRVGGLNAGVEIDDQRTLTLRDVDDLTPEELWLLESRQKGSSAALRSKTDPEAKVRWEQGRDYYTVTVNSAVDKKAAKIKARLSAGTSGSTDLMVHAAENLGMSYEDKLRLRLAMLGWMLSNRDHSFFEIMTSAWNYGLPFAFDEARPGSEYEEPGNFWPMDVVKIRALLPEREFPRYFLSHEYVKHEQLRDHRDVLADALELPDADLGTLRDLLELAGVPRFIVEALSDDQVATASALQEAVVAFSTKLIDRNALPTAGDELSAGRVNTLRLHYLREDPAYLSLARGLGASQTDMLLQALVEHAGGEPAGTRPPRVAALAADLTSNHGLLPIHVSHLPDEAIVDLHRFAGIVATTAFGTDVTANNAAFAALWHVAEFVRLRNHAGQMWAENVVPLMVEAHHPGTPTDGGVQASTAQASIRTSLERIALGAPSTSGRWYSWGDRAYLQGFASTSNIGKHALGGAHSPQGFGLYVSNLSKGSQGYGAGAGCGLAVVELTGVATIDTSVAPTRVQVQQLLGTPAVDFGPLHKVENYGEFLYIYQGQYGDFSWARLTTSHGVKVTLDLSRFPPMEIKAIYDGVTKPEARANLKRQAEDYGVDTSTWAVP